MAKKKLTQEEEVVRLLKKQGFREVTSEELKSEPYVSMSKKPECYSFDKSSKARMPAT